ncbi:MAG: hypothetical protein R3C03_23800 [Pirellulaceae bacterium]
MPQSTNQSHRSFRFGRALSVRGLARHFLLLFGFALCCWANGPLNTQAQEQEIPDALKPWREWVLWGTEEMAAPAVYNDPGTRISYWPSTLKLDVGGNGGQWAIELEVFAKSWIPIPGNHEHWPQQVRVGDEPVVIVDRNGVPHVKLEAGNHTVTGRFLWSELPQHLAVPNEIGLINLAIEGEVVAFPDRDRSGQIMLKKTVFDEKIQNTIDVNIYRLFRDGIPLWMETIVEVTVSGNAREEDIGCVVPQDWKLFNVNSPLPTAIDESGNMSVQVRSGKWSIRFSSFQANETNNIQYPANARIAVGSELFGLQPNPSFRLIELQNVLPVDISQTNYPAEWNQNTVYQWETTNAIEIVEKIRGMGMQRPEGLEIERGLWLDDDGGGITFYDQLAGTDQRVWRLDVGESQVLGGVRVNGDAQLVTKNPKTQESGVEIRDRRIDVSAVGRIESTDDLSAVGWQVDADSLVATLHLPPGWRAFWVRGPDEVR